MEKKKALIAMSGGVDSSVAALLMQRKGYDCIGITMKLYNNEEAGISETHTCCSLSDIEDARSVALNLGMPYYVTNFMDGFKEKVINNFVLTYIDGQTPNPCIDCNRCMKFDDLIQKAKEYGCEKIVTGHYARVEKTEDGKFLLKKGLDPTKDQSYVLYFLSQEQLSMIEFPLGDTEKLDNRELAREAGLINANKHDSQDICFVPDGNYKRVVEKYAADLVPGFKLPGEGDFVDKDGNVLGKHKGYYYYTIGQRKGLGISAKEPLYVIKTIPKKNQVVLGSNDDLFTKNVHAVRFHFINQPDEIVKEIRCAAKIRYRAKETPGVLHINDDGSVDMVFDEAVRAVTAGQSLVVYDGDIVLGGGFIAYI